MSKKDTLEAGLIDLQTTPPQTTQETASRWASVYHEYASTLLAGGTMSPTNLNKGLIESQLALVVGPTFFTLLGTSIATYWMSVVWAAPGFTGVTASALGADIALLAASIKISSMTDQAAAASELASTLHSHALTVTITMTNISSGITTPITLV